MRFLKPDVERAKEGMEAPCKRHNVLETVYLGPLELLVGVLISESLQYSPEGLRARLRLRQSVCSRDVCRLVQNTALRRTAATLIDL